MTQTLSDLTITQAVSKALELVIYGSYQQEIAEKPQYSWHAPYSGTYEEYLTSQISEAGDYDSDIEGEVTEDTDLDIPGLWESFKGEHTEGTRDGWTGKVVDSFGGEGQGDQYWMVISLSDGVNTRYFRKDGWYASYAGGELDSETSEVTAKEKTIVIYE